MSQFGRIHYQFDLNEKVKRCSVGAIGLWTLCNARCRREHTRGHVRDEWVTERGLEAQAGELVRERLWHRTDEGYAFHEYDEWNGDIRAKTRAARLVQENIPPDHPSLVVTQLQGVVAELLEEGHADNTIIGALKLWLTRKIAPSSLPHLVSDVVKDKTMGLEQEWRKAWKTGDLSGLAAHGFIWTPPDIPIEMDLQQARQFLMASKREWIESHFGR